MFGTHIWQRLLYTLQAQEQILHIQHLKTQQSYKVGISRPSLQKTKLEAQKEQGDSASKQQKENENPDLIWYIKNKNPQ